MWYFTWMLGLGCALLFGVLNGMWYEYRLGAADDDAQLDLIRH
ncbi:cyd operon protein YbgT [Endobacter medicaginis]|jgi:cytochrome bd-I ubiquinol oxidase subunit X|uniref:Cyd operon protein YbgT n=1 Tax=Endobacter medicaginis TaxID=1181271 RepID=A0A850NM68_9PROT|nr:cytochrome bd-I oxidase subunit CydX [Endobacter medicaginis]MBB3172384.1 cyd operon protein YbgT [Endobacter medicaginis]MCX5474126.1 cytochrome bd-I oxidase subunit CydX [Endobacter medicaginis]NVN29040.1 cytochrome bd-I oxidase subunit CydX [Endobacter medicaginis]